MPSRLQKARLLAALGIYAVPDDAFYPEPLTALAYRFGVNYLVYAMTH